MAVLVGQAQLAAITRQTALELLNGSRVSNAIGAIGIVKRFVARRLQLINEPVELLQPPDWLLGQLAAGNAIWGDCDDAAMLVAALLRAMGLPVRLRAVWPPEGDGHVFAEVWDGLSWRAADPTTFERPPASWESMVVDV